MGYTVRECMTFCTSSSTCVGFVIVRSGGLVHLVTLLSRLRAHATVPHLLGMIEWTGGLVVTCLGKYAGGCYVRGGVLAAPEAITADTRDCYQRIA
jgi:hypothetical protein